MRKLRILGIVIGVAAVFTVVVPASAQATHYDMWYCGTLKGSGNWCGQPPYTGGHSWDANTAIYSGSPPIWVCQRVWHPGGQYALPGSSCDSDGGVSHYYGNIVCACYEAHVAQISGGNHTVWGFAEA